MTAHARDIVAASNAGSGSDGAAAYTEAVQLLQILPERGVRPRGTS